MPDKRLTSSHALGVLVLLMALNAGGSSLLAQRASLTPVLPSPAAYESVSGMVVFGFSPYREASSTPSLDLVDMLPPESDIPAMSHSLLDDMWRGSATFRRQWTRVAAARVRIAIAFDRSSASDSVHAQSEITRKPDLRVRISLRLADRAATEYLAHELEHVLEQLDEVDLAHAVASHVHGAKANGTPPVFETRRAIVIGRVVAAEVQAYRDRRS
jgi:hypothetical protein